jgi:hypothetical protein
VRQPLDHDEVRRFIDADPATVFDLVSDVTRTPELSPYIRECVWLDGATGPAVGARFKSVNNVGRGPAWSNKPVVTAYVPGKEFAFARTEKFVGTLEWRYRLEPRNGGVEVIESYDVTRPISLFGWFVIGTVYGIKDNRATLRTGMEETLERLAGVVERRPAQD